MCPLGSSFSGLSRESAETCGFAMIRGVGLAPVLERPADPRDKPEDDGVGRDDGGGGQSAKSVETDTLRQSDRMAASAACFASMTATVSLPSGRRTGGLGASAKA